MRKIFLLIALVAILPVAISLTACGGDTPNYAGHAIIGTWTNSVQSGGETRTNVMIFHENGTCQMIIISSDSAGTETAIVKYRLDGANIKYFMESYTLEGTFAISGDTLTITTQEQPTPQTLTRIAVK